MKKKRKKLTKAVVFPSQKNREEEDLNSVLTKPTVFLVGSRSEFLTI
jgi:hypothetical protein